MDGAVTEYHEVFLSLSIPGAWSEQMANPRVGAPSSTDTYIISSFGPEHISKPPSREPKIWPSHALVWWGRQHRADGAIWTPGTLGPFRQYRYTH